MKSFKEKSMLVKAFVFVAIAVILTATGTYAFFRANIEGVESESTISVGGATLEIKYEGAQTIIAQNIIPGWSSKKYFNIDITNGSGQAISFNVNLVVQKSNFYTTTNSTNSYLQYALYKCSSSTDKTCSTVITNTKTLTKQSGTDKVATVKTSENGKIYYALEMKFPDTGTSQSQTGTDGKVLTFNGYVTIDTSDKVYVNDNVIAEPVSFASDSWATIAANVQAKKEATATVYSVGSEKEVEIDNNGTKKSYIVRIANNSNYDCTLASKTACGFVVEFVDIVEKRAMNSSSTNVGGWPATEMRTYLNGTFKSKLPSDLQNVLANTTVVSGYGEEDSGNFTSTDKLYLLSTAEVWTNGLASDSAIGSTRQLDYYANNNVTSNNGGAVKKYNGTVAWWWLRTALFGMYNNFLNVYSDGDWNYGAANDTSGGVAPAFRIG